MRVRDAGFLIGSLWFGTACGGARPAPPRAPATLPVATDAQMKQLADGICECTGNDECFEDTLDHPAKHLDGSPAPFQLDDAQRSQLTQVAHDTCGGTYDEGPSLGQGDEDVDDGAPPADSTGIDECDEYVELVATYQGCVAVPTSAREAAQRGVDAMRDGWKGLENAPPDTIAAARDACKQATDALRQGALAMGCHL